MSADALSLFDIASQYHRVTELIEQVDEEGKLNEELWNTLYNVEEKLEDKLESYAYIIRKFEAEINYLDEEVKRLKTRKELRQRKIEWLKSNIMDVFRTLDKKKVETPKVSVRVQNNPPAVKILDEQKIPANFKELTMYTNIKKKEILSYFKDTGELIPGIDITVGKSLRIT